ncbi:hypothetical protein GCM10011390_03500 [Aureimonas endophytica]|uniref:Uncharacterized protein n=2 Tax=Aureimonas endophytica TaxID=2027858 RepID=A0A916ZD72_9HYPH|nr:hypothetical protein GCM10011390_03500 [Aureimonas endophytica]
MAQFSHPELGGMGQWSRGGMLMIGDMFNDGLKGRVRALIDDLATLDPAEIAGPATGQGGGSAPKRWWPDELGQPATSGGQNDQLYAVFPAHRRLAIKRGERVTIHDTGDHRIGGASQQQGASRSLSFSTPEGSIVADDLPIVAEY